jgi:3-hydroxyisobutyrate dehydrogenase
MAQTPTVAVLGTGLLGAPVARNLRRHDFAVRVWNRTAEKAATLAEHGCEPAASPADAVRGAAFVISVLADASATERVLLDDGVVDAMDSDAVLIQLGTIGIEPTERLASIADERGLAFLDAPVSGSQQPAEEGSLVILAGGRQDALDRAAPVLEAMGRQTVHAGDAGAGTRLKLVINAWLVMTLESLAETISLAEAIGTAPEAFLRAIEGGPIGMPYAQLKGSAMIERRFTPPAFPLRLTAKDATLSRDAGLSHGQPLPVLEAVIAHAQRAGRLGHEESDMAALFLGARGTDDTPSTGGGAA